MMQSHWNDEFLDQMRTQGDPAADAVVAALFAQNDIPAVNQLLEHLFRADQLVPEGLPAIVQQYLADTTVPQKRDAETAMRGEKLFAEHGPAIMMLLGCYSLPMAYGARKGVHVLYRTGYLSNRPNRRLFETAQMVMDVMAPGGLSPNGRGLRTTQKVRLMHAAIRYLLEHDREQPWDGAALGRPINQEDLAGTLMTFSWVILDGLRRMHVSIADQDAEAYFDAWKLVGKLMGVRSELIPDNLADAATLTQTIWGRQSAPSDEGRMLTRALIDALNRDIPGGQTLDTASTLMRHFLRPDIASALNIPDLPVRDRMVALATDYLGMLESDLDKLHVGQRVLRAVSIHVLDAIIARRTTVVGRAFIVPETLQQLWRS